MPVPSSPGAHTALVSSFLHLAGGAVLVDGGEQLASLVRRFELDADLLGAFVRDGQRLVSLVSRRALLEAFSRPQFREHFGRRSVRRALPHFGPMPRMVGPFEPMAPVLAEALARREGRAYDPIPCMAEGRVFVLDTRRVLAEQCRLMEVAARDLAREKQRAEAAAAAKSAFLANMSHEIRTPMTAILGFADLLGERGLDERERAEYVQTIRANGEHLLAILNDVLDFSKIEAGKLAVSPEPVELVPLLEDLEQLFARRAAEKGLRFELELRWPLPRLVVTDPVRFRQVLINFISNALKFTEQGRVRVTCSRDSDDAIRVDVSDTGIGIGQAELDQLFEPFAQADDSTCRRFGGTGLGLAICWQLARLLEAELTVDSTPGSGSVFSMRLAHGMGSSPELVHAPIRRHLPEQAQRGGPPLAGRVLLAEDGRDNQRLVSLILRRAGCEVEIVENGQLAVERVQAGLAGDAPLLDLVLLDLHMPVMDGFQALEHLRRLGYGGPMVVLTADVLGEDRARCELAGCDGFLTKPVRRDDLIRSLRPWLARDGQGRAA